MAYSTEDDRWREYHVTPRYLAGSGGVGDPGFAPVADWPHNHLEDGPCQLMVTSPDERVRIGWFGDDYDLWKITAADDALAAPRWSATFNQNTPPEIVAGLTAALARDYTDGNDRFLASPSMYWGNSIQPLTDAGWTHGAAERGTVEIIAPDEQAGLLIDNRYHAADDETWTLWAGPPGWGTRAEAVFTARTPSHLIAATAAAMVDPAPVIRERWAINRAVEHLVRLSPVEPATTRRSDVPTPLDVRRTAVSAAIERASRDQRTDLRVRAAQSGTTTPAVRTGAATADRPDTPSLATANPPSFPRR